MPIFKTKEGLDINYDIIYKDIKNTYLRVRNNHVYISTNKKAKEKDLFILLSKYEKYILKRLTNNIFLFSYKETKEIYYFGKKYIYESIKSDIDKVELSSSKLTCYYKTNEDRTILSFYKKELSLKLEEVLKKLNPYFESKGLKASGYEIKKFKTKWGTCNFMTKKIQLNLALAFLEERFLLYILHHEHSHLKYPNHSNMFYIFFKSIYPSYLTEKHDIKKYSLS